MAITAADVNKLRQMTGAGMMDCKKALTETDGDFEKAIENIRKKGMSVANKRADRETTEGAVLSKVSADGKFGALIVLNCETDFVAKNDTFVAFATSILDAAVANKPADVEALKALTIDGRVIGDLILEQTGIVGERFDLAAYEQITAGTVVAYIHPGNKLATLVGFNQEGVATQPARDVAMQVAAMNPVSVDSSNVPQDVIAKELEIAKELARNEGKPENMLDKIAEGRLQKFFKESTLMEQSFVKDNKVTIKQYLDSVSKGLTVTAFKRYTLNN